jgi:hypothetical protein
MTREGETIRRIREAISNGTLRQRFNASDVNHAIGITFAGIFLPKHRVGNPNGETEHFVRITRGLYQLR